MQPHFYRELFRYGLHKNLKSSAGGLGPEKMYFKAKGSAPADVDPLQYGAALQNTADKVFEVDGLTPRQLMPYPHEPFREPALWKRYDSLTVRQRLDQLDLPDFERALFESTVGSFGSGHPTQVGFVEALRWYALGGYNMSQVFELAAIFKLGGGGMTSFARAILEDAKCDISLQTVISSISQERGDIVTIRSADGRTFSAGTVVCTVPLNCLGDVAFSPPLSAPKRQAILDGHMNKGAKIHFKLAQIEPGWFAACNAEGDSPFCFAFSDHNGTGPSNPAGTFCIGFGYNDRLGDPTDHKTIVGDFEKCVRPGADVDAYLTHDWMNDPYAKGVWSCWGPGAMTRDQQELQKAHGRVMFASADWADGWRGFIDGALESGLKAANDAAALVQAVLKAKI
jgi:monoamine oxidase